MSLSSPVNTTLPFIAYGSFKPSELRHNLIKDYIEDFYEYQLPGYLEEKDGIPIFRLGNNESNTNIDAFILNFKVGSETMAYQKICENEPDSYYEWSIIENKNILIGKRGLKGTNVFFKNCWSFRNDPYFKYGLIACQSILRGNQSNNFNESERRYIQFFEFSSAYMLLWTIIERFCTLKYGNIPPSQKIKCLSSDLSIPWEDIISKINRTDTIYRSDKLNEALVLNKEKGVKRILDYYYGIRSNMVHRGKEVFTDTDKIQESFIELNFLFTEILTLHGFYDKEILQ